MPQVGCNHSDGYFASNLRQTDLGAPTGYLGFCFARFIAGGGRIEYGQFDWLRIGRCGAAGEPRVTLGRVRRQGRDGWAWFLGADEAVDGVGGFLDLGDGGVVVALLGGVEDAVLEMVVE
ncbi:hypothetical protein GCM10028815_24380 [Mariniluteicoccus flavus]